MDTAGESTTHAGRSAPRRRRIVCTRWPTRTSVLVATVASLVSLGSIVAPYPAGSARATTIDGQSDSVGPMVGGVPYNVTIAGRGGVPPTGVGSVALNVTATNPTAAGYLTVSPAGQPTPTASNLNFEPGETVPNMVIVPLGTNGQVSIYASSGTVDVIIDVLGWFPAGNAFTGLTPARLMDTRSGQSTVDGAFAGIGVLPGATTGSASSTLTVLGRGGIPAGGVGSVALNVTVTNPTVAGYLTVWPTGRPTPSASNLNFVPGQTVANMVLAPIGANGQISLYASAGTVDVIVDVLGWFPTGGLFTGLTPARVVDSRASGATIDGGAAGGGELLGGTSRNVRVLGRGGVPAAGVGSVALNVTVTEPTGAGYLTVWPAGQGTPTASNLNFVPRQTVPNMVIVPVGADGQISLYASGGEVHVIVDVLGWFPSSQVFTGLTPSRLLDSRLLPAFPAGPARNQLLVRPTLHQMAGFDRVAVWVCDTPGPGKRLAVEPDAVAAWANESVVSYFSSTSSGRYAPRFTGMGHIVLAAAEGPDQCLDRAMDLTGAPFTNVLATDNTTQGSGFASPGLISTRDSQNRNLFAQPPSVTRRGMWIGGSSVSTTPDSLPAPSVLAHELGHTLHWPHSFSGSSGSEYDNPVDLMSGIPTDGWCKRPNQGGGTLTWECVPQNTLAFNRFAAGWFDDSQVRIHSTGSSTVTLDAPSAGGVQMLAAPDARDARVMLTLEARPQIGNDRFVATEGVAAHIIDQRPAACPDGVFYRSCVSASRRHQQAVLGAAGGYSHVLPVGSTTVIGGLTITVTGKAGSTFTVQVSGSYSAP